MPIPEYARVLLACIRLLNGSLALFVHAPIAVSASASRWTAQSGGQTELMCRVKRFALGSSSRSLSCLACGCILPPSHYFVFSGYQRPFLRRIADPQVGAALRAPQVPRARQVPLDPEAPQAMRESVPLPRRLRVNRSPSNRTPRVPHKASAPHRRRRRANLSPFLLLPAGSKVKP